MAKYKDINYIYERFEKVLNNININDIELGEVIVNENGEFKLQNENTISDLILKLDEFKSSLENHKQEHINKKTSEKILEIMNSDSEESEILKNIFNKNLNNDTSNNTIETN
ncbi:hypothetical protein H6K86_12080 [Staphylococcus epidermidis]|nr:hypothetical protein [Staphylococcus epidermidis]MBM6209882.1 hypothetical protein [Staphylococcus epidermidis]MBM6212271.1 hypothetical protein [Staphylococcus epidermidis]MBM6219266.1 hypothetical protein [Staphylococcus epidermidis]MBM6223788.1 hypothetical protein [Staphylococcus epidermidis]